MADIELVIKLDAEYIEQIDKLKFLIDGGIEERSLQINVINAIKNGTPIHKGHGRIIDESLVTGTFTWDNGVIECFAPTIIEADIGADIESEDYGMNVVKSETRG